MQVADGFEDSIPVWPIKHCWCPQCCGDVLLCIVIIAKDVRGRLMLKLAGEILVEESVIYALDSCRGDLLYGFLCGRPYPGLRLP